MPKATLSLHLINNVVFESVENYLLATMYLAGVQDAVSEALYQANLVGLTFSSGVTRTGLIMSFSGFSQRVFDLANTVVATFSKGTIDATHFQLIRDGLAADFKAALATDAWQQSVYVLLYFSPFLFYFFTVFSSSSP